jgi:hypothetical protein
MSVEAPVTVQVDQPADPSRHLRLVPPHDHVWRLRAVEYDDGLEVHRYECSDCDDVLYS